MKVLTDNKYYGQIADIVREQTGTNNTYKPSQMVNTLKDLFYEEVEGVPPISFQGIEENLLDYRIDGAVGGVGDLITDSSDDNYGKYKVPLTVRGKNLLKNNATSQTINGVTFTVNEDRSVTCNGKATATAFFQINSSVNSIGNILSGCPLGGGENTYLMRYQKANEYVQDIGNGVAFPNFGGGYIVIRINKNYTCNNLIFKPMIRLATVEDDTYEPYVEPTTTNIYIDEPIGENESISLSDTNTNIPTIRSTNVLTVDTTVQPSNVYVKSRHESSYETAIRENYEQELSNIESALEEV